jgi:antitoxin component YwqK of YwqJK toxin-antitoxin module
LISSGHARNIIVVGNPENSPPVRPDSVPSEARWDPKDPGFEWVVGEVDSEGRRHGVYRSWNRSGVLHGECSYDHGKVHGKNTNFHPDGTVASEADWHSGVIMNSAFYRSEAPSPEPFAQAAANVWAAKYFTRDGKTNYTIRYFLRDGTECGPDGKALPPRPKTVSAEARWFPDMDRWVDGEIERGTNKQVGRWRWWSREGVLRHEEIRDAAGEPTMIAQYEADGSIEKKTTRNADGEERDYYFDGGTLSTRHREDAKGRQIYKGSWLRNGSLHEERVVTYDGDAIASVTERGRGGVLELEARREGPALACVLYHDDGKTIAATGGHSGEKLAGTWKIFDETGTLRREVDMTPLEIRFGVTGDGLQWKLGEALFKVDEPTLPLPAQLAGVESEPWAETHGCYDDCVDEFPAYLRGLASPDPLVRMYCLGSIETEIEHQGSTYPATARVIPYLARLLSHPNVDRAPLLSTIQAAGDNTAPYVSQVQELAEDDPERFAIEGTAKAVSAAWPHIFAIFPKATPAERRRILVLAKYAPDASPNVLEVARNDPDPAMRACAVDSLTSIAGYMVADAIACLGDKDALVRTAAAIAIATSKGPDTPREVVAAIREAIHGYKEIAGRWTALPYVDGHVLAYLALAAGSVRSPDARSLVQALCERLDDVDGRSAITYGQGLLALAFGRGERPFAKRFVEILDTLAHSKQFWTFNVNAHEILGRWNLPREQGELTKLVLACKAAPDPESFMHAQMHAHDDDDDHDEDPDDLGGDDDDDV